MFQGGVEGKRQVDKVVDKCASMQVYLFLFSNDSNIVLFKDKF